MEGGVPVRDIIIDLRPEIDPDNVEHLRSVLAHLNEEDALTVTLESADAHQADAVFRLLEEDGWDYQPKGGDDGVYYILVTGKHGSKSDK